MSSKVSMMKKPSQSEAIVTIIEPQSRWRLVDFAELKQYRDLAYFLVSRDIRVMYAQTILGFSWAILQPLIQIVIFTVIFGKVAKVSTDGIPYILFATAAIIPWTYMSSAMAQSSSSLIADQNMLGKIYFPRLFFPITPIISKLVGFFISMTLLIVVMVYYRVTPTWNIIYLPLFMAMMICVPAGVGIFLSSLAIRYRDVRFAMQYIIQLLMYSAPIVYSASHIPSGYRFIYSLNPIVGVIEGFRASLLGHDIRWEYIFPGMVVAIILLIGSLYYFKRMEHVFADVI